MAAAPLCATACELIAGVQNTRYVGGTGGGSPDAGEGGADAGQGADAGLCSPPTSDGGAYASPLTLVPEGYGPYCSVVDPSTGAWAFDWAPAIDGGDAGFPCVDALTTLPDGVIMRAGLHPANDDAGITLAGTVLLACGDKVAPFSGMGAAPLISAKQYALNNHLTSCVFTAAPATLPLFSSPPFGPLPDGQAPAVLAAFDFDLLHAPLAVGGFGQAASPPGTMACGVDRLGREGCSFGTPAACAEAGDACAPSSCDEGDAGCMIAEGTPLGIGYTWGVPEGTPVLSVARGIVRGSLARSLPGCAAPQQEVYVEYAMGSGVTKAEPYTERFIVGYQGLSHRSVEIGTGVMPGDTIGLSGSSGCMPEPGLRFVVLRLTNLSGDLGAPPAANGLGYGYDFETAPEGPYGFNGIQGAIDPFGWGAPQGVDPWGYAFVEFAAPPGSPCGYVGPGAFSIDLWVPGTAPPTLP